MSIQLEKIKSLAKSLDEFALFSYAKRGVLLLLEFLGWMMCIALIFCALFILKYTFEIPLHEDEKFTVDLTLQINKLAEYQKALAIILLVLDIPILLTTLYLRRLRRKKSQLFELISEIKKL